MKRVLNHRVLRGAHVLLMGALLLFAQQAALSHQVGHILDHTALQSQQSKNEQARELALQHASLCDFHVAFAEVLGSVGSTPQTPHFAQQKVEHRISYVAHIAPSDVVVPASRGPPAFLLS